MYNIKQFFFGYWYLPTKKFAYFAILYSIKILFTHLHAVREVGIYHSYCSEQHHVMELSLHHWPREDQLFYI